MGVLGCQRSFRTVTVRVPCGDFDPGPRPGSACGRRVASWQGRHRRDTNHLRRCFAIPRVAGTSLRDVRASLFSCAQPGVSRAHLASAPPLLARLFRFRNARSPRENGTHCRARSPRSGQVVDDIAAYGGGMSPTHRGCATGQVTSTDRSLLARAEVSTGSARQIRSPVARVRLGSVSLLQWHERTPRGVCTPPKHSDKEQRRIRAGHTVGRWRRGSRTACRCHRGERNAPG